MTQFGIGTLLKIRRSTIVNPRKPSLNLRGSRWLRNATGIPFLMRTVRPSRPSSGSIRISRTSGTLRVAFRAIVFSVVAIDATTLNTIARKATRNVPEVREILIEPEDGRLGLTVRIKKGIPVAFRSHLEPLRFKDGFLGFTIVDLRIFRRVPIPNWVITV